MQNNNSSTSTWSKADIPPESGSSQKRNRPFLGKEHFHVNFTKISSNFYCFVLKEPPPLAEALPIIPCSIIWVPTCDCICVHSRNQLPWCHLLSFLDKYFSLEFCLRIRRFWLFVKNITDHLRRRGVREFSGRFRTDSQTVLVALWWNLDLCVCSSTFSSRTGSKSCLSFWRDHLSNSSRWKSPQEWLFVPPFTSTLLATSQRGNVKMIDWFCLENSLFCVCVSIWIWKSKLRLRQWRARW